MILYKANQIIIAVQFYFIIESTSRVLGTYKYAVFYYITSCIHYINTTSG